MFSKSNFHLYQRPQSKQNKTKCSNGVGAKKSINILFFNPAMFTFKHINTAYQAKIECIFCCCN